MLPIVGIIQKDQIFWFALSRGRCEIMKTPFKCVCFPLSFSLLDADERTFTHNMIIDLDWYLIIIVDKIISLDFDLDACVCLGDSDGWAINILERSI